MSSSRWCPPPEVGRRSRASSVRVSRRGPRPGRCRRQLVIVGRVPVGVEHADESNVSNDADVSKPPRTEPFTVAGYGSAPTGMCLTREERGRDEGGRGEREKKKTESREATIAIYLALQPSPEPLRSAAATAYRRSPTAADHHRPPQTTTDHHRPPLERRTKGVPQQASLSVVNTDRNRKRVPSTEAVRRLARRENKRSRGDGCAAAHVARVERRMEDYRGYYHGFSMRGMLRAAETIEISFRFGGFL